MMVMNRFQLLEEHDNDDMEMQYEHGMRMNVELHACITKMVWTNWNNQGLNGLIIDAQ